MTESFSELFGRWQTVADDPQPFLSLGLRDDAWLERNLDVILRAADVAPVAGSALCHLDVRSDNLCFRAGRALLVDWNWTSFANPGSRRCRVAAERHGRGRAPTVAGSARRGRAGGVRRRRLGGRGRAACTRDGTDREAVQRAQLAVALDWIDRELELLR